MTESITNFILAVLTVVLLASPFPVHAYYRRRSERFADELLEGNPSEYNRQIKANAIVLLVRRSLWGIFFLAPVIWNFRGALERGYHWSMIVSIAAATACFAFAFLGYRSEMRRLKALE